MPFFDVPLNPHYHVTFSRSDPGGTPTLAISVDNFGGTFCTISVTGTDFQLNDTFFFSAIVDNSGSGSLRARVWVQPNHNRFTDSPDLDTNTTSGCTAFAGGTPSTSPNTGLEGYYVNINRYKVTGNPP